MKLSEIIKPIKRQRFFEEYFLKKPLHIQAQDRQRYEPLNLDFDNIIKFFGKIPDPSLPKESPSVRAVPFIEQVLPKYEFSIRQGVPPKSVSIKEFLVAVQKSQGHFCISNLHMIHESLNDQARVLAAECGFDGVFSCHLYISSEGDGFNELHNDSGSINTFQVEGEKEWLYDENSCPAWNTHQGFYGASNDYPNYVKGRSDWEARELKSDLNLKRIVMRPGDFLHLPPGTWHCAKSNTSRSISLNFYLTPNRNPMNHWLIKSLWSEACGKKHWAVPLVHPRSMRTAFAQNQSVLHKQVDILLELLERVKAEPEHLEHLYDLHMEESLEAFRRTKEYGEGEAADTTMAQAACYKFTPNGFWVLDSSLLSKEQKIIFRSGTTKVVVVGEFGKFLFTQTQVLEPFSFNILEAQLSSTSEITYAEFERVISMLIKYRIVMPF